MWFRKKENKPQSFEDVIRKAEQNQKRIRKVSNDLQTIGLKAQSSTRILIKY